MQQVQLHRMTAVWQTKERTPLMQMALNGPKVQSSVDQPGSGGLHFLLTMGDEWECIRQIGLNNLSSQLRLWSDGKCKNIHSFSSTPKLLFWVNFVLRLFCDTYFIVQQLDVPCLCNIPIFAVPVVSIFKTGPKVFSCALLTVHFTSRHTGFINRVTSTVPLYTVLLNAQNCSQLVQSLVNASRLR